MNDVEELCRTLRPIFGKKIDAIYQTYLAEDAEGKREIEDTLRILHVKTLNRQLDSTTAVLPPPPQHVAVGEYFVGDVEYGGKTLYPFALREDELIQHCAIFGRSGSGKTNLGFLLIRNLLEKKKPFVIFDWKRNYRDILAQTDEEILVYTVGRDVSPIRLNPLIPPPGTSPSTHLKKLIEIIATTYYLGEGVMFLLQKAIDSVYKDHGVYDGTCEEWPIMKDVLNWLKEYPAKGREANWMASTLRAVGTLCFGEVGKTINVRRQMPLEKLLEKNVILEMDGLANNDKTFLIESFLLWIHHYLLGQGAREQFKQAILIEEAHHILLRNENVGKESVTDIILREIRELGCAIIMIDQHPSLISLPAMGNTHCTISMNLKHKSDVNAMANCMLLDGDQKENLGRLEVGSAIVKLQSRWFEPFAIRIPLIKVEKGTVTDKDIQQMMARYSSYSGPACSANQEKGAVSGVSEPDKVEKYSESTEKVSSPSDDETGLEILDENEKLLLTDIGEHPLTGVVERYDRLDLSRRKGNSVKQSLIERELIQEVKIATGTGAIHMLGVTKQGRRHLIEMGVQSKRGLSRRSILHEFWKERVARHYEEQGFAVTKEKHIKDDGTVDIEVRHYDENIAIEVETGKSDILGNIVKCLKAGYKRLIIVPTDTSAEQKIKQKLKSFHIPKPLKVQLKSWKEF